MLGRSVLLLLIPQILAAQELRVFGLERGSSRLHADSLETVRRDRSTADALFAMVSQERQGCISDGQVFIIPLGFTAAGAGLGLVAGLAVGVWTGHAPRYIRYFVPIGAAVGLAGGIYQVSRSRRCSRPRWSSTSAPQRASRIVY